MRTVFTALRRGEAFATQVYTGPAASSQMLRPYRIVPISCGLIESELRGYCHVTGPDNTRMKSNKVLTFFDFGLN